MKKTFADICATRKHCYRCLNERESFLTSIKVEGKPAGEYTCPYGITEAEKPCNKAHFTGLGDVVEYITTKTGVAKVVHKIAGENCGCKQRKEKLNKLVPFKSAQKND